MISLSNHIGIETGNRKESQSISRIGIDKIKTMPNPTHRTSPVVKVINVWIVLIVMMTFMNVYYDVLHVEYPIDGAQLGGGAGAA